MNRLLAFNSFALMIGIAVVTVSWLKTNPAQQKLKAAGLEQRFDVFGCFGDVFLWSSVAATLIYVYRRIVKTEKKRWPMHI